MKSPRPPYSIVITAQLVQVPDRDLPRFRRHVRSKKVGIWFIDPISGGWFRRLQADRFHNITAYEKKQKTRGTRRPGS